MCKQKKKTRSSQASISANSCIELSKTQLFPEIKLSKKFFLVFILCLGWPPFWWWCHNKNTLWGRCFITSTSLAPLPIGLVKTESDFIVRSVETGLGRWTLLASVISVDAYPFLAFSNLICHLEDTGVGVFWLHCAAWSPW